jgi:LysM repeat protein
VALTPRHRRPKKIRRTGRHTAPSSVEKVAHQAGKAGPAVAVVGALAAAPQAPELSAAATAVVAQQPAPARLDAAVHSLHSPARTYVVRAGDSLAVIAERFYGRAADWRVLYRANRGQISDPALIYPGQRLRVPRDPSGWASGPRHHGDSDHDGDDGYRPRHARHHHHHRQRYHGSLHGTLNCGGLEELWRSAGGAPWAEVTAASVAMAESSGRQYATGPYGERGYWQINPVNGSLSTYNAYGNARSAVIMSHNGTDWSPWTTYVDGAYRGLC